MNNISQIQFKDEIPSASKGYENHEGMITPKDYVINPVKGNKEESYRSFVPQVMNSQPYNNINIHDKRKLIEEDDLLMSLHRELPSLFSGAPASRNDIITLSHWVNA
jgi:hypothetical protein